MYNNQGHYPNSAYQSAYPQYQQNYGASYGYQGYEATYTSQSSQPVPPGEPFSRVSDNWTGSSTGYATPQKDAVAQEMLQQRAQLIKQREDYVKKVMVLRHELDQLRMQKQELVGDGTSDRDLANILKENDKLQDEIQGKMKAIHNVIEMLSSIIKDERSVSDLEASFVEQEPPKSPPPPQLKHYADSSNRSLHEHSHSPEGQKNVEDVRYCYVHYDTGLHWCRMCDQFPETAKDFLLHLQEKKHRETAKENDVDNTPWHKLPAEPILPSDEDAPKKRVPIKGLQFFISAPSWYCKLCDTWIGDLHCASHHLKSQMHFQNYENFVKQNPHWEMEWLKDREKAMSRNGVQDSSGSDTKKKKKRRDKRSSSDLFSVKEKKKKKRSKKRRKHSTDSSSSSSSSDSSSDDEAEDRSRSIRVAMRNMKHVKAIMEEDLSAKWSVLEKLVEEHKKKEERKEKDKEMEKAAKEPEDPLINQWMTVSHPQEKEKRLLENLKDRMKQKQELEKAKQLEMEMRRKEKEREERELAERKQREAREAAEEAERERKRKEQEEYERIRDKERNQVRFKTNNYRRRRSPSRSEEEEESHYEAEVHHDKHYKYDRHSSRSERDYEKPNKSRSRSPDRKSEDSKKKPPGPPSYKKLPFIGRMPLFKNKKPDEKEEKKEIKKESYEPQRRTRFQPGNLARAFIPKPDVVCFPKLSSIPPLTIPPPPIVTEPKVVVPEPPKISEKKKSPPMEVPPPPQIAKKKEEPAKNFNLSDDEMLYADPGEGLNPSMMGQYYQDYNNAMYPQHYEYPIPTPDMNSHVMPLPPPPLPPDDDLAMLGMCADDMAAQSF